MRLFLTTYFEPQKKWLWSGINYDVENSKHSSKGSVKFIGHTCFAGSAALCTPEKWFAAGRTVIPFAFSPGPFNTTLLLTILGYFRPPYGNRPFHHPYAGGKAETLNHAAWPFLTLMAGVIPFRSYALPYCAYPAKIIKFFRRLGLHATHTFGIFGLCSVKVRHNSFEFFVSIPGCNIDSADTTIQSTWCH